MEVKMIRRIGLGVALLGSLLLVVGCGDKNPTGPENAPAVTYTVINNGMGLRLVWIALSDADGYNIYINGTKATNITAVTYDVTTPAKTVAVCGYKGDEEGPSWTLDLALATTSSITVYGISDANPAHESGFGFNSSGDAVPYALSNTSNWPNVDFYLNDVTSGHMQLWNSGDSAGGPRMNTKGNASVEMAGTTDFDAVDTAAATGNYSTQSDLTTINAVYSIWIDLTNNGYDVTDHFGKLKVLSISGATVGLKIGYQKIAGLRWLVSP